jgi:hypothetical protein
MATTMTATYTAKKISPMLAVTEDPNGCLVFVGEPTRE